MLHAITDGKKSQDDQGGNRSHPVEGRWGNLAGIAQDRGWLVGGHLFLADRRRCDGAEDYVAHRHSEEVKCLIVERRNKIGILRIEVNIGQ